MRFLIPFFSTDYPLGEITPIRAPVLFPNLTFSIEKPIKPPF
jgi:hypothetical protein